MRETLRRLKEYRSVFGSRGIGLALRARLSSAPFEASATPENVASPVFLRLKASDFETYIKVFIQREYQLPLKKQPSFIVDAGANVGFTAVFFANLYPQAKVVAVEPEASNFALLQKNAAPYKNITAIRAALWKENGVIDLVDPGIGHYGFQTKEFLGASDSKRDRVASLTVDSLMAQHGIPYIDLLKMDIEGAEKEVFENASAWIDKIGVLAIELHDRFKIGCNRSFYLATSGFDKEHHKGENVFMLRHDYVPDGF